MLYYREHACKNKIYKERSICFLLILPHSKPSSQHHDQMSPINIWSGLRVMIQPRTDARSSANFSLQPFQHLLPYLRSHLFTFQGALTTTFTATEGQYHLYKFGASSSSWYFPHYPPAFSVELCLASYKLICMFWTICMSSCPCVQKLSVNDWDDVVHGLAF